MCCGCSRGGRSGGGACSIETALALGLRYWPKQKVGGDGAVVACGEVDTRLKEYNIEI